MDSRQVFKAAGVPTDTCTKDRYCPKCGTQYGDAGDANERRCESCGGRSYKNPLPAVVTIVHRDGEILVGKRATGALSQASGACLVASSNSEKISCRQAVAKSMRKLAYPYVSSQS